MIILIVVFLSCAPVWECCQSRYLYSIELLSLLCNSESGLPHQITEFISLCSSVMVRNHAIKIFIFRFNSFMLTKQAPSIIFTLMLLMIIHCNWIQQ